jgi:hypothetical protein
MINLLTAIYSKISGSSFATAIGSRFYQGEAPIGGADYPYVVFKIVTNRPDNTMSSSYEDVVIQFDLFSTASGTTEIHTIYGYLKSLYDECSLSISGGDTLIWMHRNFASFMPEEHTTPSGTSRVWAYHVEYTIIEKV